MDKQEVKAFFDRCAGSWDAETVRNEAVISEILDHAGVVSGSDVLDVACGTGVLIPDYLARNVHSITAIDLSEEMIRIARSKYPQPNVRFFCGDAETYLFDRCFDCIVIYNAFPHFPHPEHLIATLSQQLKPGGILTVAHGMSRAALDRHHQSCADQVSLGLMHEDLLAELFFRYLTPCVKISNQQMYQVAGKKE